MIFFNFKLCVWKLLIKFGFTYGNIFLANLLQSMPEVNYFITQVVDVQLTGEWISQVLVFKGFETIKRITGWRFNISQHDYTNEQSCDNLLDA